MFPLLLQTIISNQMRPRRLRGAQVWTLTVQLALSSSTSMPVWQQMCYDDETQSVIHWAMSATTSAARPSDSLCSRWYAPGKTCKVYKRKILSRRVGQSSLAKAALNQWGKSRTLYHVAWVPKRLLRDPFSCICTAKHHDRLIDDHAEGILIATLSISRKCTYLLTTV